MAEYPVISESTAKGKYIINSNQNYASPTDIYTLNAYQNDAGTTAIYPGSGTGDHRAINYTILGLIGESGELANKWKKFYRDNNSDNPTTSTTDNTTSTTDNNNLTALKNQLTAELGDVLWYVSRLAAEVDISLGDLALQNIVKLQDRMSRNTIKGSGDHR